MLLVDDQICYAARLYHHSCGAGLRSISATILDTLGTVAGRLPRNFALGGGRLLGDAMSVAVRSRRQRVLSNLELALGDELQPGQRRRLMHQVFRHFGENLIETLLLPGMVAEGLDQYVSYEGWHFLEAAVAGGKGAIVFTGHFGNWELTALAQGARGIPMDVVGRPPNDPDVAHRLESIRTLTGNRLISKRRAVRPMLRSLSQGRTVGLVVDQNVGAGRGLFVDFFGHKASTTPSLAVLALKTGVPVLPVFTFPGQDGHRIVYGPPIDYQRTGNRDHDILELTQRVTSIIEKEVRRNPQLWLWMHNRWRSRPADGNGRTAVQTGAGDGGQESRRP